MKKRAAVMILAAAAGLGLGLSAPQTADAATTYSYVVGQGGSTVQSGGTVNTTAGTQTFNVYLQEVSTTGSFTAASDGGLFAAGVAVSDTSGTGVTFTSVAPNSGTEPTGFSGNPAGTVKDPPIWHVYADGTGGYIRDLTGSSASTGVAPVSTVGNTSLYLLGTVTMNVADGANQTLSVTSLYDAPTNEGVPGAGKNDSNTLTFGNNSPNFTNYDLDGLHGSGAVAPPGETAANLADANPTTFAIVAPSSVPEPASMAVFGLGAVGLLARRRRTA